MKKMKRMKASILYKKKILKTFAKTAYYKAQFKNMKDINFIEMEKRRLATPKIEIIDTLIKYYVSKGKGELSPIGKILEGI